MKNWVVILTDSGLRVFTSLDPYRKPNWNKRSRSKVRFKTAGKDLDSAAIGSDRHSGEIRAMVGGKQGSYEGVQPQPLMREE